MMLIGLKKIIPKVPGLEKAITKFREYQSSYIIILDPNEADNHAYVCNITPWLTPHFN